MKKGLFSCLLMAGIAASLITGCGGSDDTGTKAEAQTETAENSTEAAQGTEEINGSDEAAEETEAAGADRTAAGLSELSGLLGMKDEDTAGLLGGGKENWTEDKKFYIGRIYEVELEGEDCTVYTTCEDDGTVSSVSVWIVNGDRKVTDEEAAAWADELTVFMGAEPLTSGEISEGGSKNLNWMSNGLAASLYQMEDILTISLQPAVGELK